PAQPRLALLFQGLTLRADLRRHVGLDRVPQSLLEVGEPLVPLGTTREDLRIEGHCLGGVDRDEEVPLVDRLAKDQPPTLPAALNEVEVDPDAGDVARHAFHRPALHDPQLRLRDRPITLDLDADTTYGVQHPVTSSEAVTCSSDEVLRGRLAAPGGHHRAARVPERQEPIP